MKKLPLSHSLRVIAFLALTIAGFKILGYAASQHVSGARDFPFIASIALIGCMIIVLGAVIIASSVSTGVVHIVANLLTSSRLASAADELLQPVEEKLARNDIEGAITECKRIAKENSQNVRPYARMLEIAGQELKDQEPARVLLNRGKAALRDESSREELQTTYDFLVSSMVSHKRRSRRHLSS